MLFSSCHILNVEQYIYILIIEYIQTILIFIWNNIYIYYNLQLYNVIYIYVHSHTFSMNLRRHGALIFRIISIAIMAKYSAT